MLLYDPETPRTFAVGEKLVTPIKVGDKTHRQEIVFSRTPPYRYHDLFLLIIQARHARDEPVFGGVNDRSHPTAIKIIEFFDHVTVHLERRYVLVAKGAVGYDVASALAFALDHVHPHGVGLQWEKVGAGTQLPPNALTRSRTSQGKCSGADCDRTFAHWAVILCDQARRSRPVADPQGPALLIYRAVLWPGAGDFTKPLPGTGS